MNVKELTRKIEKEMPANLSELEKAAFIMMTIAQNRSFNSSFYWGTRLSRNYQEKKFYRKNNKKLKDRSEAVCITTSIVFQEIAKHFGITAYFIGDSGIISKDSLKVFPPHDHLSSLVKLADGRLIRTDVEWNFEHIHSRRRWVRFGTMEKNDIGLSTLTREELDRILVKIGYINNPGEYLDTYIDSLTEKLQGYSLEDKLNAIFSDPHILDITSKIPGATECCRTYRSIIKAVTARDNPDKREPGQNIFTYGVYTRDKQHKKEYSFCLACDHPEDNSKSIWIWSHKSRRMEPVQPQELAYYIKEHKITMEAGPATNVIAKFKDLMAYINSASPVNPDETKSNDNFNNFLVKE